VNWNLLETQLLRGQPPSVAADNDAIFVRDDCLPPAKFLDAGSVAYKADFVGLIKNVWSAAGDTVLQLEWESV
jgi:hypothetical protein